MLLKWKTPFTFALAVWHTLNYWLDGRPVIAPAEVQRHRLQACYQCPHRHFSQCRLCTCLLDVKTILSAEQCPDKPARWKKLTFSGKSPRERPIA